MFYSLLEKSAANIYRIYHALVQQKQQTMSMIALAHKTQLSEKTIRRAVLQFKHQLQSAAPEITFSVHNQYITLFTFANFDEIQFYSILLKNSLMFTLLYTLLDCPLCRLNDLSCLLYASRQTIRRKLQQLQPILQPFDLHIDFKKIPLLQGNESQLRYLAFQLSLYRKPLLKKATQFLYKRFENLHFSRISAGQKIADNRFSSLKKLPPFIETFYLIDDCSYLFLWKQLLSKEPLHPPAPFIATIETILNKLFLKYSNQYSEFQHLVANLYRLYLFSAIFKGPLLHMTPIKSLNTVTKKFLTLSYQYSPHYSTIIAKHPELLHWYEKLFIDYLYLLSENEPSVVAEQ